MRLVVWSCLFTAVLLAAVLPVRSEDPPKKSKLPVTGEADARYARFDRTMTEFLEKHDLPGAALAVGRNGKVLYARGFGYADRDTKQAVRPESLFRISSISKPITATAILQLVEQGKLKLDSSVFSVLGLKAPTKDFDPRWKDVTIRHLLEHRGGWDSNKSRDPMFLSPLIVKEMGGTHPAMPGTIIRYVLKQKLDFDPGEKFSYSNFGYCLLGRVIERVSRQSYEAHVKKAVLAPLGIRSMRLGRTLQGNRAVGEVRYHSNNKSPALMGLALGKQVPTPYGGFCLEAMDAHAGWLASAGELLRFGQAFDDPKTCKILSEKSIETMFARPGSEEAKPPVYYARGWVVRDFGMGRLAYWHDGALDGSGAMLVHRVDGISFAILLNSREKAAGVEPIAAIELPLHQAIDAVFGGK